MRRVLAAMLIALGISAWCGLESASADETPCGTLVCVPTVAGIDTSMSRDRVAGLKQTPADDGQTPIDAAYIGPRYEYETTSGCTDNAPGEVGADAQCTRAVTAQGVGKVGFTRRG